MKNTKFVPMSSADFADFLNISVQSESLLRDRIQTALLQCAFAAFDTDYKTIGYDAPHFNALLDALDEMRGVNKHAVAIWLRKFAPVSQEKATGLFLVDATKSNKLVLSALEADDKANTFWSWAVAEGATKPWYEFDEANKKAAQSEFDLESADRLVKNLIKKLNGAQYGNIAEAIQKAYDTEKLAVSLAASEL